MHLEKIRLDKIQNGRLSAIIHFHMAVIWSTVQNGQIQNGPLSAIIYFHMPNILQTVLDVSPLL